jgi:hypothetical protein
MSCGDEIAEPRTHERIVVVVIRAHAAWSLLGQSGSPKQIPQTYS